jgi:hypothetical protein
MKAESRHQARAKIVRDEADLILALENARTRFVVAVALEQKSITRRAWRMYLETDDRLRHSLKALRVLGKSRCDGSRQCVLALEILTRRSVVVGHQLPGKGDARRFYYVLQEVLEHLENIVPD